MSGHSYQNKIHIDKKSTETKISYVDILHLKAQFNCYFLVVFFTTGTYIHGSAEH